MIRRFGSVIAMALAISSGGCENGRSAPGAPQQVVEVVATGLRFEAPDEIPSGWTTFRFRNETAMTHFVILEKMPVYDGEQTTLQDSKAVVVPVFQNFMDSLAARPLSFPEAGLALPEWYSKVLFFGGPGLVAPGRTAETTVLLEPGTYVIECYVKTGGVFHSASGMIDQIVVTEGVGAADDAAAADEPASTLRVTVSSAGGIEVEGTPTPGEHTVAVHFEDQKVYSHFLGHDVHLVRIDDDTDVAALAAWMNWAVPGEFETPAPAEFLGGAQEMPAGSTAYVDVLLEPGAYAWIAEVPDPAAKNMLRTFTVPAGSASAANEIAGRATEIAGSGAAAPEPPERDDPMAMAAWALSGLEDTQAQRTSSGGTALEARLTPEYLKGEWCALYGQERSLYVFSGDDSYRAASAAINYRLDHESTAEGDRKSLLEDAEVTEVEDDRFVLLVHGIRQNVFERGRGQCVASS